MELARTASTPQVIDKNDGQEVWLVSPRMYKETDLVEKYLALRSKVFVEHLGWDDLNVVNGSEVDQYDSDTSYYVLLIDSSTRAIHAGLRVSATVHEQYVSPLSEDPTSYMLRDACLGRLPGIPSDICHAPPPQSQRVVELSRLISNHPRSLRRLIDVACCHFTNQGMEQCLGLAKPSFIRLSKQWGYEAYPLGPIQEMTGSKYQAIAFNPQKKPRPSRRGWPVAREKYVA